MSVRKARFLKPHLITVLLTFALAACQGQSTGDSDALATAADTTAETSLLERSAREASNRETLVLAQDSLDTVAIVLNDALALLSNDRTEVEQVRRSFFTRIQRILREATSGWVEHHADGSWMINKKIKLSTLGLACKEPTLLGQRSDEVGFTVIGQREADSEVMHLQLNGCGYQGGNDLARIQSSADGKIEVYFDPEQFEAPNVELSAHGHTREPFCRISIYGESAVFACAEHEVKYPSHILSVAGLHLEIHKGRLSDGGGTLTLRHRENQEGIAVVSVNQGEDLLGLNFCLGRSDCLAKGMIPGGLTTESDAPAPELANEVPPPEPAPAVAEASPLPSPEVTEPVEAAGVPDSAEIAANPSPSPEPDASPSPEPSPSPSQSLTSE